MSEENVEIMRRGYALFAAGDFEAVTAMLSDDVESTDFRWTWSHGLGRRYSPGSRGISPVH